MAAKYILYVGHDHKNSKQFCKGSISCMEHLSEIPDELIHIQDVDILRQKTTLPNWLNGTPILVEKHSLHQFKGTNAVEKLQSIKMSQSQGNEISSEETSENPQNLDDDFRIDAIAAQTREKDGKITEHDLQAFIAQRNSSGPSVSSPPPQLNNQ